MGSSGSGGASTDHAALCLLDERRALCFDQRILVVRDFGGSRFMRQGGGNGDAGMACQLVLCLPACWPEKEEKLKKEHSPLVTTGSPIRRSRNVGGRRARRCQRCSHCRPLRQKPSYQFGKGALYCLL